MDKVIRQILQIGAEAKKKVEEARQKREELIAKVDQEAGKEAEKLRSHSADKIVLIRKTEEAAAKEEIALIQKQTDAQIRSLEQAFAEKEPEWLEEIISAVTGA